MAKIDESAQKQWIKNLWMNPSVRQNESLWSRVSEMVNAFNGELQMQRDNRRMKPDSVPVGVDCTLSPVLPNNNFNSATRSEFCATSISATISATESSVKTVVCSPDIPVYPIAAQPVEEVTVDPPATQTQSAQGILTKIYQCTICSEGFNQKVSLTAHLKTHTKESEDPYQCNFCGKTFAVPARLTRHYRTHTGEKPYQCEYCKKSFSVKENLSVHTRIHTKERPYKCDVCERAFEHSGKLHRHMRIHTGERPHKCTYCSKTFIQSGQLVIHLRTHTGEKPYVCKSCNKGFTCSKQLKVHTRTHTGEKPYTCDICGKSFGYNHVLKLHQVAHYGVKEYKCTICKQTFNSKKLMESHIKTHSDSNAARGPEGESSCASSTSDKENKVEIVSEMPFSHSTVSGRSPMVTSMPSSGSPSSMDRIRESDSRVIIASKPTPYENCAYNMQTGTTTVSIGQTKESDSRNLRYFDPSCLPSSHNGLNLLVAATATDELICYQNNNMRLQPSKFVIPAAGDQYYNNSPPSYSDSSRSSPSPKLEVNEMVDEVGYYVSEYDRQLSPQNHRLQQPLVFSNAPASSVSVPSPDGPTPPSSSSTSPVPSSPDFVDLAVNKDELKLPPRKRTKAILESMSLEKAKAEDCNFRYNSVIQYAKASS
uniref:Kruppel homolog 1 isoform A n=2 Tax=Planococcus kraunhiae TaxID=494597 RepID=A0A146J4X3_9HEMI|nr:Kruppel homolog 1 isoform A [Planococcus kraunhiae]